MYLERGEKMDRQNVLLVGPYPPPFGGIASYLADVVPYLQRNGYETHVLSHGEKEEEVEKNGASFSYVNLKSYSKKHPLEMSRLLVRHRAFLNGLTIARMSKIVANALSIREQMRRHNCSTICLFDTDEGMTLPLLQHIVDGGFRSAWMMFGEFYKNPEPYRAIGGYVQQLLDTTDVLMASSEYCARSTEMIIPSTQNVEVCYVGVDVERFHPEKNGNRVREELGIPNTAPVLMFLGRMHPEMGLDFVIDILPELLGQFPDLYAILGGAKGELSDAAERMANDEKRVKVRMNIPFDDLPSYYAACDVFLAPTREKHACMGVSIKEAMASGKPIVASNSGGIPEAVENGVNGFTVSFSKGQMPQAEFIQHCAQLIENHEMRASFGAKGRQLVLQKFSVDKTNQRFYEIIQRLQKLDE
jgi:glycosyltransferase involved in cell wall biosynthesis